MFSQNSIAATSHESAKDSARQVRGMRSHNPHDASGQMTGYLYQILSSLLLLIENKEPQAQICVEKFDDVAFVEKDTPQVMIQTKHQMWRQGNLTNASADLWRTIRSWANAIQNDTNNLMDTDFLIITTASIPENSIASLLSESGERNCAKALRVLLEIAHANAESSNSKYYQAFLGLDALRQEYLVKHIYVYGSASTIRDIKRDMLPYIRCATLSDFVDRVYDRIVGWWINVVIDCLCSDAPVFINRVQLQNQLYDIGSEYKADSLPINVDFQYQPTDEELAKLSPENRAFIEQLKLVAVSNDRIKRCIRDYYNAFQQRSQWLREQLLFVNELTKYEVTLVDEWNRLYLVMKEDLDDYGAKLSEDQKAKAGRELFGYVENLNLAIRERVVQPFIMRGTYHELANQLRVGWHIDFMDRLCHLLKG